ncbi:protein ACCELERATED CELL DEATH 6-like, partial [Fagus crenata]
MAGDLHFSESLNEDDNSNFLCQVTPKKNTVMYVAAEFNQSEFVKVVTLRCPLLFQQANSMDDTTLHIVARVGKRSLLIVKLLIEADPEFSNYTNDAQKPSLYLAAAEGFFGIAERILYVFSSSSSHVGANGMTASHAAVDFKYP